MLGFLSQKMLEPFEKHEDVKFGFNSELLNTLKKGTTLVEYRWSCSYTLCI